VADISSECPADIVGIGNPDELARHRDPRCHASPETVRQALVGNDREECQAT
jgi:transposase